MMGMRPPLPVVKVVVNVDSSKKVPEPKTHEQKEEENREYLASSGSSCAGY
tara:strand:- start:1232 stop:1384 length:153 start_codon:yes stop_codon:yes gene_type:complete